MMYLSYRKQFDESEKTTRKQDFSSDTEWVNRFSCTNDYLLLTKVDQHPLSRRYNKKIVTRLLWKLKASFYRWVTFPARKQNIWRNSYLFTVCLRAVAAYTSSHADCPILSENQPDILYMSICWKIAEPFLKVLNKHKKRPGSSLWSGAGAHTCCAKLRTWANEPACIHPAPRSQPRVRAWTE